MTNIEISRATVDDAAISFYQSIGANPQNKCVGYRLAGEALVEFADS